MRGSVLVLRRRRGPLLAAGRRADELRASYGYQRFTARDFPTVSRSTASLFCGYTRIGQ